MARVNLEIFRGRHAPTAAILPHLAAIRVIAQAKLVLPNTKGGYCLCVVDSGAAVSLFPERMWRGGTIRPLGRVRVGGLISRDECRIEVVVAEVPCVISDGTESIGPRPILAYLSESNSVPALLGIAGIFEDCKLHLSIAEGVAYIES